MQTKTTKAAKAKKAIAAPKKVVAKKKAVKQAKVKTVKAPPTPKVAKKAKPSKPVVKNPTVSVPPVLQVKKVKTVVKPAVPATAPVLAQKKPGEYLSNRELYEEIKRCLVKQQMSDRLAKMLQLLCSKYAKRGNFINYSYNEDMQSYAMFMLVRTWASFNPAKSNNPFAFFTQCIKNSFIQFLNQEKRQRVIRDTMLVDQGLNPSYSFGDTGAGEESGEVSIIPTQEYTEGTSDQFEVDVD